MTEVYEMPAFVAEWLERNKIPLDPQERGQAVWAEWDARRGHLLLGWWGEANCTVCGQSDRPERSLVTPAGFDSNNWQHGCGRWWSPFEGMVDLTVGRSDELDEESLLDVLDAELRDLRTEQEGEVLRIRAALAADLKRFLHEYPDEDVRQEAATGSETEPGIWRPEYGQWENWDYDPRTEGDTITVAEQDLPRTRLIEGVS